MNALENKAPEQQNMREMHERGRMPEHTPERRASTAQRNAARWAKKREQHPAAIAWQQRMAEKKAARIAARKAVQP